NLGGETDGIGLLGAVVVVLRLDRIFVQRAGTDVGHEALPDAGGAARVEVERAVLPVIEVADDADLAGVGGPDGEVRAGDAILRAGVSTEFFVEPVVFAFAEEVEVEVGEKGCHNGTMVLQYKPQNRCAYPVAWEFILCT